MRTTRRWCALVAATMLAAAGCTDRIAAPNAPGAPRTPAAPAAGLYVGPLRYFGYVGGTDDAMLNGTDSYSNFGWFSTDANEYSTAATSTINRLAQHGEKTIIDMGNLLWCGTGQVTLCAGWQTRLANWKAANNAALTSGNVIAISVRDEPFNLQANIAQLDSASKEVKRLLPSVNILLIDAAVKIAPDDPNTWFQLYKNLLTTVDWLCTDMYQIHPNDPTFTKALGKLKAQWPGRKVVYAADGWWSYNGAHTAAFGGDTTVMAGIMREWFNAATADPDAIVLGVFIWDTFNEGVGSADLPRAVTLEQMNVGRTITQRTRSQSYLPRGAFQSLSPSGLAKGWACDPDAAWAEVVQVEFYVDGVFAGSTLAEGNDTTHHASASECRSGRFHRFTAQLSRTGHNTTAVIRDLNSGSTTLQAPATATVEWVLPSSASWGPANTLTAAGLTTNGNGGGVQMVWRDATANGAWNVVSWQPAPAGDGSWSNTIPTSNYCHDYQVYANYSGAQSATFTYRGLTSGYCNEAARVIWIQPASTAGFGPAGSLVVAGSATGAPSGTTVVMYWRDVTAFGGWVQEPYAAPTDGSGTWYNSIPNANAAHQYAVYVKYDVKTSSTCTYAGTGGITWC